MPGSILIADDEAHYVRLVELYLGAEGYKVVGAANGEEALQKAHRLRPDLIVLDIMLPRVSGWDVCRRLRKDSRIPIIMLTARDDDVDKIVGLELGADDYVTKPFNPRELAARVKAVLRRSQASVAQEARVVDVGNVRLDPARYEVSVAGTPLDLSGREFALLQVLAQEHGRVVARDALLSRAWGYDYLGESRAVDARLVGLREKLAGAGAAVRIESVRGVGYKLVAAPVAAPPQ